MLGSVLLSCAANHVVRVERQGTSVVVEVPRSSVPNMRALREAATAEAQNVRSSLNPLAEARARFGFPARSGLFLYDARSARLLPEEVGGAQPWSGPELDDLTRGYLLMCQRRHQAGDCLRLLAEGPLLGSDGKYAVAMAIALGAVWDETLTALVGWAAPEAVTAMIVSTLTVYMLLWTLPEPTSKGVAALLTTLAIGYLGVDTVWSLISGWLRLVREVDQAVTFDAVRGSGERYGAVLGRDVARILVMLVTVAMSETAPKAIGLPESPPFLLNLQPQLGAASVQAVTMTAEGFTVALAAAAMVSSPSGGGFAEPADLLQTALRSGAEAYKGSTRLGHALSKHAGRNPERWGKLTGNPQTWHEQALKQLQSIWEAPGAFERVTDPSTGLTFLEKWAGGRGLRLNLDGTFKGFLDHP